MCVEMTSVNNNQGYPLRCYKDIILLSVLTLIIVCSKQSMLYEIISSLIKYEKS